MVMPISPYSSLNKLKLETRKLFVDKRSIGSTSLEDMSKMGVMPTVIGRRKFPKSEDPPSIIQEITNTFSSSSQLYVIC